MIEPNMDHSFTVDCPKCHHEYTHHQDVWIYERENGQEDNTSYVYEFENSTKTKTNMNPSKRRNAVTFLMLGECGHEFLMHVIQHKGQTIIEFE